MDKQFSASNSSCCAFSKDVQKNSHSKTFNQRYGMTSLTVTSSFYIFCPFCCQKKWTFVLYSLAKFQVLERARTSSHSAGTNSHCIITQIRNCVKVIPLKLFYYQTFLKLSKINIQDMTIKKMQ